MGDDYSLFMCHFVVSFGFYLLWQLGTCMDTPVYIYIIDLQDCLAMDLNNNLLWLIKQINLQHTKNDKSKNQDRVQSNWMIGSYYMTCNFFFFFYTHFTIINSLWKYIHICLWFTNHWLELKLLKKIVLFCLIWR